MRPGLHTLLAHSVSAGLRTTVTPSATPLLTGDYMSADPRCVYEPRGFTAMREMARTSLR